MSAGAWDDTAWACEAMRLDVELRVAVRTKLGGEASIVAAIGRAIRLCQDERVRTHAAEGARLLGKVLDEQGGRVPVTDADRAVWPTYIAAARKHLDADPAVSALVEAELGPVDVAP